MHPKGMILIRLYSETGLFDEVQFRPGLNVVLGKYSVGQQGSGINGIGKSSLVRMVDYVLLSSTAEDLFKGHRYAFVEQEDHRVALEFRVGGESFTVRRGFGFRGIIELRVGGGRFEEVSKVDLKRFLTSKVFPVDDPRSVIEGDRFRTLMNFFVKDDLKHHERVDPTQWAHRNVKRLESAKYNLFLLGLPTTGIDKLQHAIDRYQKLDQGIKSIVRQVERQAKRPISEVRNQLNAIRDRIATLENALREFEFQEIYKVYEGRIDEISKDIARELLEYQTNDRKLRRIEEAMALDPEVDLNGVRRIYNEVKSAFGDAVVRALSEVVDFKRELIGNRNKYLVAKRRELQDLVAASLNSIGALERERGRLLRLLNQEGALEGLQNVYEEMVYEKAQMDSAAQLLSESQDISKQLGDAEVVVSEARRDTASELSDAGDSISELQSRFRDIIANAIYLDEDVYGAYFELRVDLGGRRDAVPFKIHVAIPKADALGQSRLKIIAYDLMVFLYNVDRDRGMPRFLIHDGVFHGIEYRTKVNVLNYVHYRLREMPFSQYIVTFNEDELPESAEDRVAHLSFDLESVTIARYEDREDRMFFKRAFS
jgi:uncharacterized protein YydD (DUF2326 family)